MSTYQQLRTHRAAAAFSGRLALAGLNAVVALLAFCLPEREPHPVIYKQTEQLMDLLGQDDVWPLAYLRWELAMLEELGFGWLGHHIHDIAVAVAHSVPEAWHGFVEWTATATMDGIFGLLLGFILVCWPPPK